VAQQQPSPEEQSEEEALVPPWSAVRVVRSVQGLGLVWSVAAVKSS